MQCGSMSCCWTVWPWFIITGQCAVRCLGRHQASFSPTFLDATSVFVCKRVIYNLPLSNWSLHIRHSSQPTSPKKMLSLNWTSIHGSVKFAKCFRFSFQTVSQLYAHFLMLCLCKRSKHTMYKTLLQKSQLQYRAQHCNQLRERQFSLVYTKTVYPCCTICWSYTLHST